LFENKAFFNNFLPIDRSLIDNDFRDFDVSNLDVMVHHPKLFHIQANYSPYCIVELVNQL